MQTFDTKTFEFEHGVAVQLPPEWNIEANATVWVERNGDTIYVYTSRHVESNDGGQKRVERLVANLSAIGPVGEIGPREPIQPPDRPGQ